MALVKVMFVQAVKYNGVKYAGNVVIEADEKDLDSLMNAGAYLVKQALIGEARNGHKLIIPVQTEMPADASKAAQATGEQKGSDEVKAPIKSQKKTAKKGKK